jgi:transposase InsO family protein
MELWQLDVMGGVVLADGTELKLVTGIEDHSRYCVAAGLVPRGIGRAVRGVFTAAMRRHGVPEEVLTDNGKQFTSRFGLHHGEVLFDRSCREHGIVHRLTRPRSPTTTGKVERLHCTSRRLATPGPSAARSTSAGSSRSPAATIRPAVSRLDRRSWCAAKPAWSRSSTTAGWSAP